MRRIFLALSVAAVFFICACQTVNNQNNYVLRSQNVLLSNLCEKYHLAWTWDSISQIITLDLKNTEAKILVGSNVVLVGGQQVQLSRQVEMLGSQITVPADFEQRVIEPSFQREPLEVLQTERKFTTVLIDAGHGGHDTGAIARNGIFEKDIVLDVAKRVGKYFEQHGLKVEYTRASDRFVTLDDRTEFVSRHPEADLFLSIHANSSRSRSAYGVEVYSLRPLDYEGQHETRRLSNQDLFFSKIPMDTSSKEVGSIVADMLYSHKQRDSSVLARKVAQNTAWMARTKNRGIRESRFFVLRNTLIPAVLVEIGFLSNTKEERLLETPEYRQKIAHGIAKGVLDYARVK
ncbi:MAG: N-acetylmuramoyl-L-alanine amidase [Candidatus Omnitrophica bacterium]|nr:N-acetylmuramoyl-L-alanine amidase [Candidatus Omnitrophota bacterium]